ncbi:MAG: thiamine protein [Sporomusa sp.]|nr:thiamine protein [Sporomusa sp.]
MVLEIRLFATLRNYFPDKPGGVLSMEVEEVITIDELITRLTINPDEIKIIMVNGIQAQPGQTLKHGDRVGLFPPVGGG